MSSLGIIGALAEGYNQQANIERQRQFENDQRARDLQLGLVKELISNPNVPDEYKGQLVQHGMDVINTPVGKRLPSFDKVIQSLPAIQRPQTTPQVQAPEIQLPSAPPDAGFVPRESNASPLGGPITSSGIQASPLGGPITTSAAIPASSIQKPAGSPSVPVVPNPAAAAPPMLPAMGAGASGPTLPQTPIAMPTPPPIAQAGQFHMLSGPEMVDRQMAIATEHANRLIANGVPRQQALIVAGLAPKPEYVHGAFGAPLYDAYTGQPLDQTGGAGQVRPKGTPQTFQTPNGIVSLQQVQTGDGKYHWEDLSGNMVIPDSSWTKLVPSLLPTDRTSNTSDEFGTKSTTTTRTQKTVPGKSPAPVKTAAGTSQSSTNDGLTPSQRRADFQNNQYAQRAVQRDAIKASADTRTMVNLLDTQTDYMKSIADGGNPTPRQDLSLIVAAVRAMNPGTVRLPQKELELELKAGSFGDRFRRYFETASEGTLPSDQREDLFRVVNNETTKAATNAALNWQQAMGKQPVPTHLKRFVNQIVPPSAPPTTQTNQQQIAVTDPNGGVHYFPDQASADKFKQLAGINK